MYYALLSSFVFLTYLMGKVRWITDNRNTKIPLYFMITAFAVLLALRPLDFNDTLSYKMIYEELDIHHNYGFDLFGEVLTVEYGFLYFMKFCKFLGFRVEGFFVIYNLIISGITVFAAGKLIDIESDSNYPVNRYELLSLYISYFGTYYLGIAMREGACFGFTFLMIYFLKNKRYLKALTAFACGFLMHRLMIISLVIAVIYFWGDIQFKKRTYFIVWFISGLYILFNTGIYIQNQIANLLLQILPHIGMSAYLGYVKNYFMSQFSFSWVNFILWAYVGILTYLYLKEHRRRAILNIIYSGLIVSNLLYTLKGSCRIYDFFTVFSIVAIVSSEKRIKTENRTSYQSFRSLSIIAIKAVGLFLNYYIVYCY